MVSQAVFNKKTVLLRRVLFRGYLSIKKSGYDLGVEFIALDLPEYHPYTL